MRPEVPKSRPKAESGVGFLGRGSEPHQLGVWGALSSSPAGFGAEP